MGSRPNRTVFLVDKKTKVYTNVGVGWETTEGRLSIILNPGVHLDWSMCRDFYINVNSVHDTPNEQVTEGGKVGELDDIPF